MRKKSFAEIVAEVQSAPTVSAPAPSSWDGPLRDPGGHALTSLGSLRPAAARQLVLGGARLAWDGCGCGDYPPAWIAPSTAAAAATKTKPTFARGNACETSIELWRDECGDVVCLHGDVDWGFDFPKR